MARIRSDAFSAGSPRVPSTVIPTTCRKRLARSCSSPHPERSEARAKIGQEARCAREDLCRTSSNHNSRKTVHAERDAAWSLDARKRAMAALSDERTRDWHGDSQGSFEVRLAQRTRGLNELEKRRRNLFDDVHFTVLK